MKFVRRTAQPPNVDMSPLIDMVFILLIFFMVSTTFVKDMELELERPGAASASRASSKAVRVYIDAASAVYIDDEPVRPYALQSRVRERLRAGAPADLLIVTDRRVPAELLIEVVDQCRLGGASHVGVATEGAGR